MNENNEIFKQLVKFIKEENSKQTEIIQNILKAETTEIKNEINELKVTDKETKNRISILEESNQFLRLRNETLERKLKKNNIIIFGLKTNNGSLIDNVINGLNQHLQISLSINQINNIYEVGKKLTHKPIVVEFISYCTKIEVLKNCRKLKGTGVTISEDLITKDREIRKRLLKHLKEARGKNLNSFIRGNKLYINNDPYSIEDLEKNETPALLNLSPERQKSASAPATPLILVNPENYTSETTEENDQEDEEENVSDVKTREFKTATHIYRPSTRRFVKTLEQYTTDPNKNNQPKNKGSPKK